MRCPRHVDRLATAACAVCGRYHCDACLDLVGGERVCPSCAPAARGAMASATPSASTSPPADSSTSRGRTAALIAIVVLGATLTTLALWPRGHDAEPDPGTAWASNAERASRSADCFAALEAAAVALEIHRAEEGRYPTAWSDIVPDLLPEAPTDPYRSDGGTITLTVPSWDDGSVLLYCVGPDGRDDGGRPLVPDAGRGDIVYLAR